MSATGLDPFFQKSHIFHRSFGHKPRHVQSADGLTITLDDGSTIIDATGGPAVACLGHNVPEIAVEISKQLAKVGYLFSGGGYSEDVTEELASHILMDAPGGLTKAIFVNSGSEATDAMLKLVTQYWLAKGETKRINFIARKQSYHGNTLGALSITGHEGRRRIYEHWMSRNVSFVDACHPYRGKLGGELDEDYLERLIEQLDAEFRRLGPNTVAAFVAETVAGSTLACVPPVPGYLKAVRDICDKYGALLVLDEVMCGMGRTGSMHAWQQDGIRGPDLQMIGKSLGGGFIPISGLLVHQKIFEVIAQPNGALAGGHTFQAHPVACAAALAVQKKIAREDLLSNVQAMGIELERLLRAEIEPLPFVGNIRGRGLFWAVEFVQDTISRNPFGKHIDFSDEVMEEALAQGVNVLKNMGFAGMKVDTIAITPPFIVTKLELQEIVSRLRQAIINASQPYLVQKQPSFEEQPALAQL